MKFEVFKDGKRKFHADDPRAFPSRETMERMKKAGYVIKIDGKTWKGGAIHAQG